MYRYAYGNNLGTLTLRLKDPEGPLAQIAVSHVFTHLTDQQQKYSTQAMHYDFFDEIQQACKDS